MAIAAIDSKLFPDLRNAIAEHFSADLAEAIPMTCEVLAVIAQEATDAGETTRVRNALKVLRSSQAQLAAQLGSEIRRRFDARLLPGTPGVQKVTRFSLESMTLVDDEQIQEQIAVGHCTQRLKEQSDYELFALKKRICLLIGVDELSDARNPVHPDLFARTLVDTLGAIGFTGATRLTVFKAFGPALLEIVPSVYARANQMLIQRGVQIEITRAFGAPLIRPSRAMPAAAPLGPSADIVNSLSHLFSRTLGDTSGAGVQEHAALIGALRDLEARFSADAVPNPAPVTVSQVRNEFHDKFSTADSVVADIVAAMFERLFHDPRLPDSLKALVGRLQIPVLKTALDDRSLFTNPRHPVRGIIDCVAGFGAAKLESGTVVASIAAIVEDVVREHSSNPLAFDQAFDRLTALFAHHEDDSAERDSVVQLLRDAETSQAAHTAAAAAVAARFAGLTLTIGLTAFVETCWKDLLARSWRAASGPGDAWERDLQTLDDLLWSVTPMRSRADRERLMRLLPSLLGRIDDGIAVVGLDPVLEETFFEELCTQHMHIVRASVSLDDAADASSGPEAPQRAASDPEATIVLPSTALANEGLYRGSWVEFTASDGDRRRCRLTWLSSSSGVCVFKDYDAGTSFAIDLDDLKSRFAARTAALVEGYGLARAAIDGAIRDVAGEMLPG